MGLLSWILGSTRSNNTINSSQSVVNNVMQSAVNNCSFICGNTNQNTNITVLNSSNTNIDFAQSCTIAGTSCLVQNMFDTSITTILESTTKQSVSNVASLFQSSKSTNNTTLSQNVRNNISQLISNNCQNRVQNSNNNSYIFVGNSKNTDINFSQTGSITNADCNFDNTAKLAVYTKESAKIIEAVKNIGILAVILGILMVGALIFALFIGFFLLRSNGSDASQKQGPQPPGGAQPPGGGGEAKSGESSPMGTQISPTEAESAVEADPELLALA